MGEAATRGLPRGFLTFHFGQGAKKDRYTPALTRSKLFRPSYRSSVGMSIIVEVNPEGFQRLLQ